MNDPIVINAPASKSLSHRTLIAGALASGTSVISGALDSDDIRRTRACLEACGARIEEQGDALAVTGMENGPRGGNADGKHKDEAPVELYMHESGTTCRLITAVAAAGNGTFRLHGAERMHERPMAELFGALETLGTRFHYEGRKGFLPVMMSARGFKGKRVEITLEESSQYLSGLLLGAPLADRPVTISVTGKKAVSWPYVGLTLKIMEDFKAGFAVEILKDGKWERVPWKTVKSVTPNAMRFVVEPTGYQPSDYRVEGDWSNASYFAAAGAVGHSPVLLKGLAADSQQGDKAVLDILAQMGAEVNVGFDGISVRPSKLHGIDVDMGRCPDIVPTIAVAAAFADSPTTIRNVAHLRIKESDRLQASADEIAKTGCRTEVGEDSLTIIPAPLPRDGEIGFSTYGDHRMAMSMSLFALAGLTPKLDNPGCVNKSFPEFFDKWNKILEG
ncbi:3-phosphoshikimate 1-carboxyvinyltransferase [Pseudodesulfovibrio tunisiensis]|uniref:3-phosphoshikimate 1-carboxyvinyltransferase n=1 Tax=Pseudodesulfovibrio tunisiensis TaxID=463192 RepID=UPI001FB2C851|nr:3-phosphoshikimate 1-carboxyvinyltransferase [Pseudodesulfovibrio tunisiensis]